MLTSIFEWFERHNSFICGFLVASNLYSALIAFSVRKDMISAIIDILLAAWFFSAYKPGPREDK